MSRLSAGLPSHMKASFINRSNMRQFITLFIIGLCSALTADAQTYLDHLQQKKHGKATVTVVQSKAIDSLVNGNKKNATQDLATGKKNTDNTPKDFTPLKETTPDNEQATTKGTEERREENRKKEAARQPVETEDEMNIPTVDMRKKVMTRSYKVNGYRVQAFMGGNTRADHRRAEQIRDAIKMKFPDQPVYVHFYSPRWVCRVGNYRSYEEASRMLKQIRAMGYKSATILKGKITVQY